MRVSFGGEELVEKHLETQTQRPLPSSSSSSSDSLHGRFLRYCHPKTGETTCYLMTNGELQEVNWFKQSYASWFVGDYISQDGSLYAASQVDPVFILLPLFDQARMKNGDDQDKFRKLDEIIYLHDYPGYHYLANITEYYMEVVCDCKGSVTQTQAAPVTNDVPSTFFSKPAASEKASLQPKRKPMTQDDIDAIMLGAYKIDEASTSEKTITKLTFFSSSSMNN